MAKVNEATQKAIEIKMFGCSLDDMVDGVKASLMFRSQGSVFFAMSILSDVQEMIERNQRELARQYINRAKYILANSEELDNSL